MTSSHIKGLKVKLYIDKPRQLAAWLVQVP